MKRIVVLIVMLSVTALFADDRGKFSDQIQIRANTSTSSSDTTMIDTVSFVYRGWPTMTIFWQFVDTLSVATTMYFETQVKGNFANTQWVITDSLQVATASLDTMRAWNITDAAIGITDSWRLRKSTSDDTLKAVFQGYNENFD